MANYKIKWNFNFFKNTRNSAEVQSLCLKSANEVKKKCHKGTYIADVKAGKNRCHGLVKTGDYKARKDNAENNTLAKALNG